MVLHAAVATLLTRLGAGTDLPLGSAIAGRTDERLDDLVGFFVNTLVLRTDTSGDPEFGELLRRVRDTDLEAYAHQELPFDLLVERLNPDRALGRQPLFQVMLVLQSAPDAEPRLGDLRVEPEPVSPGVSKFDLSFSLEEEYDDHGDPAGLSGYVEYSTELYDAGTVEHFVTMLASLLDAATEVPETPLSLLPLDSAPARSRSEVAGPSDTTADLFGRSRAAGRTPPPWWVRTSNSPTGNWTRERTASHGIPRSGRGPEQWWGSSCRVRSTWWWPPSPL